MKKSNVTAVVVAAIVGTTYLSSTLDVISNEEPESAVSGASTSGPGCDPNYSGCVPIASDVDCAGGGGNGPAYVTGPITVIGTDIYELDGDGDGRACE